MLGGRRGYSLGNFTRARKLPPVREDDVESVVILRVDALLRGGDDAHTSVPFYFVVNHQHDLPLKNIVVVNKAARYPWNILVGLHLFELPAQQGRCS